MTGIRVVMCLVFGVAAVVAVTPASIAAQDLVEIRTSEGLIVAEVYPEQAPITVTNFMDYVDDQLFDGGSFFRVVRPDNQPGDSVRIGVIQGGPDRAISPERYRPAIPLERTRDTGLLHRDGTLSMARAGPDTARAQFFICVGDQASLDFGGARNPDGQGFAAFGRVIEGMDVVRRIQERAADGQQLVDVVGIESVRRLEGAR